MEHISNALDFLLGTQACIPSRNKKVQTELSGIMPQTSSSSNCGDPEQRYAKVLGLQCLEHLNAIWQQPLHLFLC